MGLCVSRAAATVLNLNLGALLLLMCKSLMAALRGLLSMVILITRTVTETFVIILALSLIIQ